MAALVLCADLAGTIAYLRADHREQVVEAPRPPAVLPQAR